MSWYEYFPKDEQDFKATVRMYLLRCPKRGAKLKQRVEQANAMLDQLGIEMPQLHNAAPIEHWTEAYWQGYMKGGVYLVYNKVIKAGVVLIVAKSEAAKYRVSVH